MFNETKLTFVKKIGIFGISFFILLVGIAIGFGLGGKEHSPKKTPAPTEQKEKTTSLNAKTVNQFLIAYYTKKDLGENRNRYEPLVTSAMYTQLVKQEEAPVNQAYKGYIVNQVFDHAETYVNTDDNTAICVVYYKNTQRMKKGTDEKALFDQSNQETIKLTFQPQGNHFLVDQMEPIQLSNEVTDQNNSYKKNLIQTPGKESTASSSTSTKEK